MFELKNSWKNVRRNIKRYLIVGVIIFIISFISVIAMIVNQSSKSTIDYYLNEYGTSATIDIDPEQMSASFDKSSSGGQGGPVDIDTITYDQYEQFADSEYVSDVSFQQMTMVVNDDLVTSDDSSSDGADDQPSVMMSGEGGRQMSGGFTLIGSDSLETSSYFADDANVLVDGEMPTSDKQVLISSDLASYNDLSVGDTIKFSDMDGENAVKLTISGLYQAASSEQMMMGVQNNVFTNYNTVSDFTSERSNITATYTLTSYDVVDEFEAELYDEGLDEMYYVNNNQTLLNQIIGPVESTMSILNNVLIVVFIIGGALLIFINLLILRERKYEIGVLRALGMKTRTVTSGLMNEMVIVTVCAMMVATVVGIGLSQPISDALIASNSASSEMAPQNQMSGGHGFSMSMQPSATSEEAVTSIDVEVNVQVLLSTLAINLVLVVITTFVASRFINRQHPNEILREQ